jgi:hypothetical protein
MILSLNVTKIGTTRDLCPDGNGLTGNGIVAS